MISEITATLPFTEFDFMQKYRDSFAVCELGRIYAKLPLKELKERLPRNKYHDIDRSRLAYAKQRKHTKAATSKLHRRLLYLFGKQIEQWNKLCKIYTTDIVLTAEHNTRLSAVKEVCRQQSTLAQKKEIKHRIVSTDRPYIRPIVRGKENKRVEFGAKVTTSKLIEYPS